MIFAQLENQSLSTGDYPRGGEGGSKREAQLRACSFSGLCVETRLPEQSTRTTNQNKKCKLEIKMGGGGWGSIGVI